MRCWRMRWSKRSEVPAQVRQLLNYESVWATWEVAVLLPVQEPPHATPAEIVMKLN